MDSFPAHAIISSEVKARQRSGWPARRTKSSTQYRFKAGHRLVFDCAAVTGRALERPGSTFWPLYRISGYTVALDLSARLRVSMICVLPRSHR
jgi:hypothetical protein